LCVCAGAEDDGIVALSTALRGSTRALVRLDLSTNEMMGEGAKALASLVKRLRALTSLRFADNDELGGAGARAIARAVLAGPQRTLTALDASGCRLKDGGVAALAAAAAACPALVTCGLDGSRLTPGGLAAAVKALTDAGKAAPAMDECEEPDEDEDEEEEEGEGSDAESEDSRGGAAAADRDGDVDKLADMMRAL
jgi:Ran GTPase-activating protein (RanGAP) involved in mRNA processing and transport